MKRGDIVLVIAPGDYGKPRPSVVIQSDLFNATHDSLILCLFTSELKDLPLIRLTVHPSPGNGLREISQIMVDKMLALPKNRIRDRIGTLEDDATLALNSCISVILGMAGR